MVVDVMAARITLFCLLLLSKWLTSSRCELLFSKGKLGRLNKQLFLTIGLTVLLSNNLSI